MGHMPAIALGREVAGGVDSFYSGTVVGIAADGDGTKNRRVVL